MRSLSFEAVQFRLLGAVELIADEREIGLPKPRSRAVLAFLLLSANRLVTTDSLVDALWGETPPATARNQIQADISALRRALRQSGLRDPIKTTSHGYQIALHTPELDLLVFQELRRSAQALSEKDDPSPAADVLHEALDLWRGQPLGDVSGAFVDTARVALTEQYLHAAEDWADLELRAGRHRAVVPALTALAQRHPLREGIIRPLALALYRDAQTPEALAVLRDLRAGLARELGIDLPAGLAELEVAILRGEAEPEPRQPGHIGPAAQPPAGALVGVHVNALPAAVVGFTGRRSELSQLDALGSGGTALVTVTGSAGIGKTALVLHWAHQAAQRFPDGLLYVDLCGFSHQPPLSAIEALSRLLHQLGVAPAQIPAREDYAADLYRSRLAGKRALVVLDNARDSDQVRALLPGEAGCATVVTSRIELSGLVAREGAVPIQLDVLSPPEARRLLGALLGQHDGPEVDELARICAFVPLALRIAAASVLCRPQQGLRDHIARIRSADRLDALRLDGDDDTAMATTLMHSYQLLAPEARRLFRLLSLMPGPDFTAAAASGVAQLRGDEAARLLDRLATAHLVEEREPGRFAFHDLLRLYAARQMQIEEEPAQRAGAVHSLYSHYVARADMAARRLYPQVLRLPGDEPPSADVFGSDAAAIAWLDAERHNLVAAVISGCDRGPRRLSWRLADSLRGYFFLKMFTVDWQSVANAALVAAQAEGDRRAQAAALLSLADLQWRQGDHDLADSAYSQAIDHAMADGWLAGEATAVGNLGGMRRMQGRLAEAAALIERSLALNVEIGRSEGQLVNLGNLGIIHGEIGNWSQAEDYLERALVLCRRVGSRTGQAVALSNLVDAAIHLGKLDLARDRLDQALVLHRELGDNAAQASTLRSLALIQRHQGDLRAASDTARQAVTLAEESADHRVLAHCLQANAEILRIAGAANEACELAERAAKLAHEAGHRFVETRALLGLARVQRGRRRPHLALAAARQALALAESCGYQELMAEAAREVDLCIAPTGKVG